MTLQTQHGISDNSPAVLTDEQRRRQEAAKITVVDQMKMVFRKRPLTVIL